jgi:hypothetical protein
VVRAYKAAFVVDGISEQPLEDGVVVARDGSIASVGRDLYAAAMIGCRNFVAAAGCTHIGSN